MQNGVELHLGDGVNTFKDDGHAVTVELKSGKSPGVNLVILSIGVCQTVSWPKRQVRSINWDGL